MRLAELDLTQAHNDLTQAVLLAPTAGILVNVAVNVGERVVQDSTSPSFVLADVSSYLLKVEIDEIDIGDLGL